jgi:hypothetical protein
MNKFDFYQLLMDLLASLSVIIIASFGGLVKYLTDNTDKKFSFKLMITRIVVSGFTGLVVSWLLGDTTMSQNFQNALIAISGYGGGTILDALLSVVRKKLDADNKEDKKK